MSISAQTWRLSIVSLTILLATATCSGLGMRVENPRTLPAKAGESVLVYFVLNNGSFSEETFLGASSDVAAGIEIHRSALIKPADQAEMETGGAYHYEPEQEVSVEEKKDELAAEEAKLPMDVINSMRIISGHEIELEPGYYHLMLIGLTRDLNVGDQFKITLHFANAKDLVISVLVVSEIQ